MTATEARAAATFDEDRATHWAAAELCRRALADVVATLAPIGVELLAIKGIHIAYAIAQHPADRPLGDADAVVVAGTYARAIDRLRGVGRWQVREDDWSAHMVTDRATGAAVDLHRMVYPPFFPALPLDVLLANAIAAPPVFGASMLVPHPVDAAAITLANHTKDRLGVYGRGSARLDLELLASRAHVTSAQLATRLDALGLHRVGLVALTAVARDDRSFAPWVIACSHGAGERAWASAMVDALRAATKASDALGLIVFRALADRLVDIPKSIALGAASRLPWRIARAIELHHMATDSSDGCR